MDRTIEVWMPLSVYNPDTMVIVAFDDTDDTMMLAEMPVSVFEAMF